MRYTQTNTNNKREDLFVNHTVQCIGCGSCITDCIRRAITAVSGGVSVDLELCNRCGHCMAICPTDAMDNPLSPRQPLMDPMLTPEQAEMYLRSARSVRQYKPDPVPRSSMLRLLNIGRYPQTGSNTQGVSYLVIEGRDKMIELGNLFESMVRELTPKDPNLQWVLEVMDRQKALGNDQLFRGAPGLILALCDKDKPTGRESAQFALTFVALYAQTLGIGTCWAGIFERLAVNDAYAAPILEWAHVPSDRRIRAAMMVGIPDVHYRRLVERDSLDVLWR